MWGCLLTAMPLQAQTEYLKSYNVQRALEVINEDFREAYKYVDKETDDTDMNPYAWMLLGKCFGQVGANGDVLNYTNRAIELLTDKKRKRIAEDDQWLAASYLQRAEVYDVLDRQDLRKADLEAAVKIGKFEPLTEALQVEPLDVQMALAQYHFDQNEYDAADAIYEKAIAQTPHDARPVIGLGRNDMKRGLWSEAVKNFEHAHEVDAEYDPYHLYLIEPYVNLGEVDKAVDETWEALQTLSTQWNALEVLMEDSNFVKLADPMLKKLDNKAPLDVEMEFVKSTMLMHANRYEAALTSMQSLLETEALSENMHNGIRNALSSLGRLDEALDYAYKAVEKDSTSAVAIGGVGKILLDQGRYEEALVWAERAVDFGPEDVAFYALASRVQERLGERDKAVETLRTALLLEPENCLLHATLCGQLALAGRDEEMQREAEWTLKNDTVACQESCREVALMLTGRYEEALEWLDKETEAFPFDIADYLLDKAEVMLLKGDLDAALQYMKAAKEQGYCRFETLKRAPYFRDHQDLFDKL